MDIGRSMRRRRGKPRSSRSGTKARKTSGTGSGRRRGGGSWFSGPRAILTGALLLLLGSGTGYLYATQVVFPGPEQERVDLAEVPDLRGGSLEEGLQALGERGLEVALVDSIRHPDRPEGTVVGQSPFPGQLIRPGGAVEVTVSLGPARLPVPDVTRLRADRAETILRTTGFEVQVDSVEADEREGRIVATEPEAGTLLVVPSEVWMTVSLGPPLVEIPDLVGLSEEQARVRLEDVGLEVGEVEVQGRFGFSQREVIGSHPEAGEEAPRGSAVRVILGRRGFFR